ncbi:MAG TPA: hypothetical protein DD666_03275 [Advenella kashmirensis]|uniref:exo-alpha-sialidase n=1 Tax=Advenella kashmirensis TaxID=310575 RepID=A0A356LBV1_9BURK|nr:hypothetical protein [Advenella kashmirensis]
MNFTVKSIVLLVLVFAANITAAAEKSSEQILFQYDKVSCYRIPAVASSNRGHLLVAAEHRFGTPNKMAKTTDTSSKIGLIRRCSDDGRIDIVVRSSDDDGESWSEVKTAVSHKRFLGDGYTIAAAGNPTLVALREDGNYLMVFSVARSKSTGNSAACLPAKKMPAACKGGITDVSLWQSKTVDSGNTWSEPSKIEFSGLNPRTRPGPGHGLVVDNRVVVPVFGGLIISDDEGKTWKNGAQDPLEKNLSSSESNVALMDKGRIYWSARVQKSHAMRMESKGQGVSSRISAISEDGGVTFVHPKVEKRFDMPLIQSGVVSINGGRELVLSYPRLLKSRQYSISDRQDQHRNNLILSRLSDIKCGSPGAGLQLQSGSAGYSDLASLSDGRIGILMEAGLNEKWSSNPIGYITSIKWTKVSPSKLKAGELESDCVSSEGTK